MNNRRNIARLASVAVVIVALCPLLAGCTLQDALLDGVYGGISTTISTWLSDLLLATTVG